MFNCSHISVCGWLPHKAVYSSPLILSAILFHIQIGHNIHTGVVPIKCGIVAMGVNLVPVL